MYTKHNSLTSIYYLLILIISLSACKPIHDTVKISVKRKGTKYLLEQLKKNELDYEWLSAKFSTSVIINDKKRSFYARMRIRKDSVIWISASPALGIEMARVYITKDSLKFINRLNSTYFIGDLNYLDKLISTEIDFDLLQAMLTGNSVLSIPDNVRPAKEEKFKSSIDNERYLLSTLKKRKLKKTIGGKKSLLSAVYRIWLDPVTFKISAQKINEPIDNILNINNSEFKEVDSLLFPHKINVNIHNKQSIEASFNYSKISLNKPQKLPFSIPEKYERIY